MKTTKYIVFVLGMLLTGLFCASTQAQIRPLPIGQTGPVVTIKGVEISAGVPEVGETYGWMCFAKAAGDMEGNFTLSMDLASLKNPGTTTAVTHGGWTLPVYSQTFRGATYMGALYGNIEAGQVSWDKAGTTASVELKLLITGGTEMMQDINGTAVLVATVTYVEKGAGTFNGVIFFEFQ